MSNVLSTPPLTPAQAAAHFSARLAVEADVSDVHADLEAGVAEIVVVDSRSLAAWQQAHLPGAIHLPTRDVEAQASQLIPASAVVVTYCWGPGCNGATRAALAFAKLGYQVKEMIGGYEYWVREGFAVITATGSHRRPVDDLTAPSRGATCDC